MTLGLWIKASGRTKLTCRTALSQAVFTTRTAWEGRRLPAAPGWAWTIVRAIRTSHSLGGGWYDWYPRSISTAARRWSSKNARTASADAPGRTTISRPARDVHVGSARQFLRPRRFLASRTAMFNRWLKKTKSADMASLNVFVMRARQTRRRAAQPRRPVDNGDAWPRNRHRTPFYCSQRRPIAEQPTLPDSSTSYKYDRAARSRARHVVHLFGPAEPAVEPSDRKD